MAHQKKKCNHHRETPLSSAGLKQCRHVGRGGRNLVYRKVELDKMRQDSEKMNFSVEQLNLQLQIAST